MTGKRDRNTLHDGELFSSMGALYANSPLY
jgi:hypothetical protein